MSGSRDPDPELSTTRLETEVLTERADLEAMAEEWNDLLFQSAVCTVFLTWEWISAWLDAMRPDARLFVVAVRDDQGRLAAIGPFYRARCTLVRLLPYRCLRILGDAGAGSDYGNLIARKDIEADATSAVLSCLAKQGGSWDLIWLASMGPTIDAARGLEEAVKRHGFACRTRGVEFARIRLPSSFEEYLAGLPAKVRYQMRRGVERLEGQFGGLLATCRRREDLGTALEDLFTLHGSRWQERGGPGVFADPRMRSFYHALGQRMLARGWLRLDRALVGDRVVAAQVGFSFQGVFYELQRGFSPDFTNIPGGLGTALRSMVLRRCFSEGVRTYDFLGGFTEDKHRAGAERTGGCDMLIVRGSLPNRLLFLSNTWPTGRYLKFAGSRGTWSWKAR